MYVCVLACSAGVFFKARDRIKIRRHIGVRVCFLAFLFPFIVQHLVLLFSVAL